MGLLFITLTVACSLLLAHFLKVTESRRYSTINVLTINYLVAVVVAVGMNLGGGLSLLPDFPFWFWMFSIFIGLLFIINFFIFSKSVDRNGVGVSIAAMRISLLVPILLSILFYSEVMNVVKGIGILMVFVALLFFISARKDVKLSGVSSHLLLAGLFLFSGVIDSSMKVYEQEMKDVASEAHFMSVVFAAALIAGLIVSLAQGSLQKLKPQEAGLGVLIGIPNLLTSIFLIKALMLMDGSVVYSIVNLLVIAGGTLIGLIIWKDVVSRKEWIGLILAGSAILLLTLF